MDPATGILLDPSTVMVGVGALVGLFAANAWRKVWQSINTDGQVATGPEKRDLKDAAFLSAGSMFLTSAGYLFGSLLRHI